MRFSITADHREFFIKNHYIEFEGVLPPHQIISLKKNVEETIAKRLRISSENLKKKTALEIYQAGYDLWRDNDTIKKITHKQALASLASELLQATPLRSGFDQYFATFQCSAESLYGASSPLQNISSIYPLACSLILPLEDLLSPLPFFSMPLKFGNGLFISSDFSLPWPQLFSTYGLHFFLIAYAMKRSFFRADSHGPHSAYLKKLGYAYNDQLKSSTHPLLLTR